MTGDGFTRRSAGSGVAVADVQLRVRGEHAVGQQLAQLRLRPAVHDELRDEMQVGARVDVVRDAGADDRQDRRGALAAEVEPGEEPVPPSEDQPSQLALASIVGQLDVAIVEEEEQPVPLPVQIAEALPSGVLGGMTARLPSSQARSSSRIGRAVLASSAPLRRRCRPRRSRRARRRRGAR